MHLKTFYFGGYIYSYLHDRKRAYHQVMEVHKPNSLVEIQWESSQPMPEHTFRRWVEEGFPRFKDI